MTHTPDSPDDLGLLCPVDVFKELDTQGMCIYNLECVAQAFRVCRHPEVGEGTWSLIPGSPEEIAERRRLTLAAKAIRDDCEGPDPSLRQNP